MKLREQLEQEVDILKRQREEKEVRGRRSCSVITIRLDCSTVTREKCSRETRHHHYTEEAAGGDEIC